MVATTRTRRIATILPLKGCHREIERTKEDYELLSILEPSSWHFRLLLPVVWWGIFPNNWSTSPWLLWTHYPFLSSCLDTTKAVTLLAPHTTVTPWIISCRNVRKKERSTSPWISWTHFPFLSSCLDATKAAILLVKDVSSCWNFWRKLTS